ncbi:O-antigen ligase family protein [Longimicrobium terrae]|uniref:O-antigen ligase family protein n=1 Tax=Longimicrobium terrae TaxID=1639882 RepID=A0A841GNW2_9BACT|nr:O-antigen ligase family protein [Longimicrobium terrae]MBB4634530.1 hypothetical protein [Longimicrobium terrae]MBB6068580.1 hypothetical protein [Longimicrobium terrae]NNC27767.1 hypothetical protein [Longimicrobium terrae]
MTEMPFPAPRFGAAQAQAPAAVPWKAPAKRWQLLDFWLLYPVLLFALPDRLFTLPIAPESVLLLIVFYVAVLADLARGGRWMRETLARVPLPLWAFLITITLSWTVHRFGGSAELAARLGLWIVTFFFGVFFSVRLRDRTHFFQIWLGIAVLGALMFLGSPGRWWQDKVNLLSHEHRTGFGYFLSLPTAWLIFRLYVQRERRNRRLLVFALGVLGLTLLMTLARGAWLVVYLGGIALLIYRRKPLLAVTILAVTLAAAITFALTSDSTMALRLRSVWDFRIRSSSLYRLDLFLATLKSVPDLGLLGRGPGSAPRVLAGYTMQTYRHLQAEVLGTYTFVTDSDFVWLTIESGPLVTVFLILSLAWWGRELFRYFRRPGSDASDAVRSLLLLILFILMIIFDNVVTIPYGWFLLGVGIGSIPRAPRPAAAPFPRPAGAGTAAGFAARLHPPSIP